MMWVKIVNLTSTAGPSFQRMSQDIAQAWRTGREDIWFGKLKKKQPNS
jgi:hypothetical protein